MQTFLPVPDFEASALCLDYRRLGKQRLECLQLLSSLYFGGGWVNHPAARMWRGYEAALNAYGRVVCLEWRRRGYNDSLLYSFLPCVDYPLPPWFGDSSFHASHRSNLLRKDPVHYGKFGWTEPPTLEYVWPA